MTSDNVFPRNYASAFKLASKSLYVREQNTHNVLTGELISALMASKSIS